MSVKRSLRMGGGGNREEMKEMMESEKKDLLKVLLLRHPEQSEGSMNNR